MSQQSEVQMRPTTVRVTNLKSVSQTWACSCGSWLDHWSGHRGDAGDGECANATCDSKALLGGHVRLAGAPPSSAALIVPLCDECSKLEGDFWVTETWLAPAATCP